MQCGGTFLARGIKHCGQLLFCAFGIVICVSASAQALDTSVQASVDNGDVNATLILTSPTSSFSTDTMPLALSGSVSDLSQIQVYVDDVFSVTIPLDQGATMFSSTLVIPSGTHTIKLVGISPLADVSPTVSILVTYTPPHTPEGGQGTTSGSTGGSSSNENWGGVVIGPNGSTSASTTYIAPTQVTALPNWLYSGLRAIDIARPGDTDGQIVTMLQRAAIVTAGLGLLVFARPVLYGLYLIRFKWFGLKACRLSKHLHSSSLRFRIVGILLILGIFSFS